MAAEQRYRGDHHQGVSGARTPLVLASLALASTLWELGLSLKYRLEGKRGSSVLVEEYPSPYIFKLTPGGVDLAGQ